MIFCGSVYSLKYICRSSRWTLLVLHEPVLFTPPAAASAPVRSWLAGNRCKSWPVTHCYMRATCSGHARIRPSKNVLYINTQNAASADMPLSVVKQTGLCGIIGVAVFVQRSQLQLKSCVCLRQKRSRMKWWVKVLFIVQVHVAFCHSLTLSSSIMSPHMTQPKYLHWNYFVLVLCHLTNLKACKYRWRQIYVCFTLLLPACVLLLCHVSIIPLAEIHGF